MDNVIHLLYLFVYNYLCRNLAGDPSASWTWDRMRAPTNGVQDEICRLTQPRISTLRIDGK